MSTPSDYPHDFLKTPYSLGDTMAHLRGLATIGVETNPKYMGDWPLKIGQFILNFANVELISYHYLNALEPTRDALNKNVDRPLSARIDRILLLISQSTLLAGSDRDRIADLWNEARDLSVWRNRISHNPVLPTWHPGSDPDRDPPDLIGIPDMKLLKESDESNSISKELMNKLIDAAYAVATNLLEMGRKLHSVA
jgi:hypothetical protein